MTKKELIEIIDFLTEACVNKIAYDLGDIAFTPYMAREEDWEGTLNPSSVEVYNYYERVRSYFINQLLVKDKKELTEDEYQRVIDEYELKFVEKFWDNFDYSFLNSDMSGTYSDSEQEEINQDELFKKTDEIGEFIGFIYSNVDSIRDVLNNNFKEDSQAKTEILDALNVIEEQINVITSKVYELR